MNVLCTGNYNKSKFIPIVESLLSFFNEFPKHSLYFDNYIQLEKIKNLNNLDNIYNCNYLTELVMSSETSRRSS